MHVISKKRFEEAAREYHNQRIALLDLYRILKKENYKNPDEMRRVFSSLDNFKYQDKWWVIDVGGNHLRLIAYIQFSQNRMYIKYILTHSEYDKLCEHGRKGGL